MVLSSGLFISLSFLVLIVIPRFNLATRSSGIIFVDGKNGTDNPNCGQQKSPCKTIGFAIRRILEANSTSGVINVLPGVYQTEAVNIDCGDRLLDKLVIQGLRNEKNDKVQISLSANIIKCNIIFDNIQWKSNSPSPVLLNFLVANISLINSMVTDLPFSIIGLGSTIELQHTAITNCVGMQPSLPLISATGLKDFNSKISLIMSAFSSNGAQLISAKEINNFEVEKSSFFSNNVSLELALFVIDSARATIEDSHFINNSGTIVKLLQLSMANISGSVFENNAVMTGSLLVVGKYVALNVFSCSFISTYGFSNGPVLSIEQEASAVDIQSSYFSCNEVNRSAHLPPVYSQSHINCTNCTVNPRCPVYCPSGSFLLDGVMCSLCPTGTYSPGEVHNITTCKPCNPGYFSSDPGSDACRPCKEGTYAAKSGSTQCSPCNNDFTTSGLGQSSCSQLTVGCIVLTVFVILLIVIPLVLLAYQHIQTTTRMIGLRAKQTDFKRLCDSPPEIIQ